MDKNNSKPIRYNLIKKTNSTSNISGVFIRSRKRINLVERIARFGKASLNRRLGFWQQNKSSNPKQVKRDNQKIRQRLSQMKSNGLDQTYTASELHHIDSQLWNFQNSKNIFDMSRGIIQKVERQPSQKGIDEPIRETDGYQRQSKALKEYTEDKQREMEQLENLQPSQDGRTSSPKHTIAPYKRVENSGRPLNILLRQRLESQLRFNFAAVRIFTNPEHASQVQETGAEALTVGNNIYFASTRFNPESRKGKALLMHELTHVRQQKQIANSTNGLSTNQLQQFEQEALLNENAILNGRTILPKKGNHMGNFSSKPINPSINVSAGGQNKSQTNETINKRVVMSAFPHRDLDTPSLNENETSETLDSNLTDLCKRISEFEEIYYSLKMSLKIEKERTGD